MGLSSCFILLGSALLYANCGLTSLDGIYVFYNIEIPSAFGEPISTIYSFGAKPEILSMGFLIMSVGYLFKVSAAPFHFWSPAGWSGKSSIWDKLPNSGDTLELLVPSHSRKAMSGWTNYSGMVISQKASEKNVGYRGSKSDFKEVTSYTILGFALSESTGLISFILINILGHFTRSAESFF